MALLREVEQMTGDPASLFPNTSQIFTPSGLNICQLDAAVIMEEDTVIGSKKTRLLPEHVSQLAKTIEVVKLSSESVPELVKFQGKRIHGNHCN